MSGASVADLVVNTEFNDNLEHVLSRYRQFIQNLGREAAAAVASGASDADLAQIARTLVEGGKYAEALVHKLAATTEEAKKASAEISRLSGIATTPERAQNAPKPRMGADPLYTKETATAMVETFRAADLTTKAVTLASQRQKGVGRDDESGLNEAARSSAIDIRNAKQDAARVQAKLAVDDQYIVAEQEIARGLAQQQAKIQGKLATDDAYIEAEVSLAVALQTQKAWIETGLAADNDYRDAQVITAEALKLKAARLDEGLAADSSYIANTTRAATAAKNLAAAEDRAQAASKLYLEANTEAATQLKRKAAAENKSNTASNAYQAAQLVAATELKRASAAETRHQTGSTTFQAANLSDTIETKLAGAKETEGQVASEEYKSATLRAAVALRRQAAVEAEGEAGSAAYQEANLAAAVALKLKAGAEAETLGSSQDYLAANTLAATALKLKAAVENESLATDGEYVTASVLAATALKQKANAELGAALADDDYKASIVEAATLAKRKVTVEAEGLQAGSDLLVATIEAATALKEKAAVEAAGLAGSVDYQEANLAAAISLKEKAATEQAALAGSADYVEAEVALTLARQEEKAAIQAGLAEEGRYAAATAAAALSREEITAQTQIAKVARTSPGIVRSGDTDLRGEAAISRAAVLKKTQADLRAAAVSTQTTEVDLQASVQRKAAEARLRSAINQRERTLLRDAVKSGEFDQDSSWFQRLQSRLSPAAGKLPTEFQGAGQFFGQKAMNVAGYGVGGLIAGGAIRGLMELVSSSAEFEKTMTRLQGQLTALGQGDSFGPMRDQIKGIAAETGQAANDVALVARRMLGVFGDPQRAIKETSSAMELAAVAGISMQDILQNTVPIAKNFGVSIEQVGDLALGIGEKFGLSEEAVVSFLGKASATAKEAGLGMDDLAIIGANMANSLGKDLDASADVFNKVPQYILQNQDKIFTIFQSRKSTTGIADTLISQVGAGQTGAALKTIIAHYNELDSAQQKQLITQLATTRDAEEMTAVMANSAAITKEMSDAASGAASNGGKLDARFKDMQGTLANTGDRLKAVFNNLGESLFSGGIGEALTQIGSAIETVTHLAGGLATAFRAVNDATKLPGLDNGLLNPLGELILLSLAATKVMTLLGVGRGAATAATEQQAIAENTLSGATARSTVTTEAETLAVGGNTVVKDQNILSTEAMALVNKANAAEAAKSTAGGGFLGLSRVAGNVKMQRLFSGSSQIQKVGLGGDAGLASLEAEGAAAGTASGIGVAAGIGIPVAAGLLVKGQYDAQKEQLGKASDAMRDALKKASDENLKKIAESHSDFWIQLAHKVFGDDIPEEAAKTEQKAREEAPAVEAISAVASSPQLATSFASKINDENTKGLVEYLNKNAAAKKVAVEYGIAQTGEGVLPLDPQDAALGLKPIARPDVVVGIDKEKTAARIKELAERVKNDPNDAGAAGLLEQFKRIYADQADLAEVRKTVNEMLSKGKNKEAIEAVGGAAFLNLTAAEATPMYERGEISRVQYLGTLRDNIANKMKIVEGAGTTPENVKAAQDEADRQKKIIATETDKAIDEQNKTFALLSKQTSSTPAADTLKQSLKTLPDKTQAGQLAAVPELIEQSNAAFQEHLKNIVDPVQKSEEAMKGYQADPALLSLLLQTEVQNDSAVQDSMFGLARAVGVDQKILTKTLSDTVVLTHKTYREAIDQYAADAIAAIRARRGGRPDPEDEAQINAIKTWQATADAAAGTLAGPDATFGADTTNAQKKTDAEAKMNKAKSYLDVQNAKVARDPMAKAQGDLNIALLEYATAQQEFAQELVDITVVNAAAAKLTGAQQAVQGVKDDVARKNARWSEVMANGDPVATTASQIDQANLDLMIAMRDHNDGGVIDAQQRLAQLGFSQRDNVNAINKAKRGVVAALVARDPVKAAQNAMDNAKAEFAEAKGEAAKWDAFVNIIKAQQGIDDAAIALIDSRSSLAIAVANASGDTVEAARLAMVDAQTKVDQARARGAGETELNPLLANLATTTAGLISARVQDSEDTIDFMMSMGQMTTQQAVAQLQLLLNTVKAGSKQYRAIQQKIHSLLQAGSADTAFNLPSQITLPTAYEARRVDQSNRAGIGYQDNRNITLALTINGASNPTAVANQVMAAFSNATGAAIYAPASLGVNN